LALRVAVRGSPARGAAVRARDGRACFTRPRFRAAFRLRVGWAADRARARRVVAARAAFRILARRAGFFLRRISVSPDL
jgi:hypothetical protein